MRSSGIPSPPRHQLRQPSLSAFEKALRPTALIIYGSANAGNFPYRFDYWAPKADLTFAAAWGAELEEVPEFSDSTIHIVAGLLLPIWKRLPNESTRVYRLQIDAGERIIGRRVSPAWTANAGTMGASTLTPDAAFTALIDGTTILDLTEGIQLRRARMMGTNRIELSGFTDATRDRLRAYGLFSEIISWKLRFFVPVDASGPAILDRLLDTFPVTRISEREAA